MVLEVVMDTLNNMFGRDNTWKILSVRNLWDLTLNINREMLRTIVFLICEPCKMLFYVLDSYSYKSRAKHLGPFNCQFGYVPILFNLNNLGSIIPSKDYLMVPVIKFFRLYSDKVLALERVSDPQALHWNRWNLPALP